MRHRVQRLKRTGTLPPTGLVRRSRRLPEELTEQLTLQAAVAMVTRTGLTVSLDHISLEDVIREANVPRSSVYRRWPYKDLFISDLVKELARAAVPTAAENEVILGLVRRLLAEHAERLDTPAGRRELILEVIRQTAAAEFATLQQSPQWRTYLALHATVMSLPAGELREQIRGILADSERSALANVAAAWQTLAALLGYRLRPETGATFETLATLLSAGVRGLSVMTVTLPELASVTSHGQPFGAAHTTDWSLPALEIASIAQALLEEDAAVKWDAARMSAVRQVMQNLRA